MFSPLAVMLKLSYRIVTRLCPSSVTRHRVPPSWKLIFLTSQIVDPEGDSAANCYCGLTVMVVSVLVTGMLWWLPGVAGTMLRVKISRSARVQGVCRVDPP